MRPEIKAYLDMSRGSKKYHASTDEVIESLAAHYKSTLDANGIEIIVIWSQFAKNELITDNKGAKIIIWDTNYWTHFAYYCKNMSSLEQHIKYHTGLSEIECDAVWRDLFRIAFLRIGGHSLKNQLLLIKYYLSYGMRTYSLEDPEKLKVLVVHETLENIATAKMYAFLHEIAHITSMQHLEYYLSILKSLFSDQQYDNTCSLVVDLDDNMPLIEREALYSCLTHLREELYSNNYSRFLEIIADMRAFHSICSSFIQFSQEINPDEFLRFKTGIALQRSFNLRIRNLEACLLGFFSSEDIHAFQNNIARSQFGTEFVIRDRLSEVTEVIILGDAFRKEAGIDIYQKYRTKNTYSQETAKTIDNSLRHHLDNLYNRITQENFTFSSNACDVTDIIDYLLYYPSEVGDCFSVNQPITAFGWSGLPFDDVVIRPEDIEET